MPATLALSQARKLRCQGVTFFAASAPMMNKITASTIKATNKNLAIPNEAPAMPPKPSTPAIKPMMAKMMAHLIIRVVP